MSKLVTRFSFTRAAILAVKRPTDQERVYVYDKRTPALALCVTQGGGRTFYVYRRIHGRPVRVRLGRFPEMTIDQARKQAAVVLAEIARGNDPQEQKRALRRQCSSVSCSRTTSKPMRRSTAVRSRGVRIGGYSISIWRYGMPAGSVRSPQRTSLPFMAGSARRRPAKPIAFLR